MIPKIPLYLKTVIFCFGILFINHIAPKTASMVRINKNEFPNFNSFIDPVYLQEAVDYHKSNEVLSKRKFTTYIIEKTSHFLSISTSDSFTLVNFILLFLH